MRQFIKKRTNDQLGLVVFGQDAYTSCPLTTDLSLLDTFVSRFTIGTVNPYGTAIGLAIATAINRLNDSSKSNIAILLTDGLNNAGNIDPITATSLAKEKNIKLYTIGVGKNKDYNADLLQTIASNTNGVFYEAKDSKSLEKIYKEINQLERHEIKQTHRFNTTELYPFLLTIAILCLLLELILTQLVIVRFLNDNR